MKKITLQLFIFLVFIQLASCQDKKIQDISIIPSQYKNLPILSSPINDSIYTIEKVMDGNFSRFFFDNLHQFYMIDNGGSDIVKLDKKVILSTVMASIGEIEDALNILINSGTKKAK